MTVGLVVARYKEDLTWINEFTDRYGDQLNVYIYNKYPSPIEHVKGPYRYEFRENVGNEAETYITHMLNQYKDEATFFVQGKPFDHVRKDQMFELMDNPSRITFEWLAFHHLPCEPMKNGCHHPELRFQEFYNDIFGKNIPDYFSFGVGGQFAISSEIMQHINVDRLSTVRNLVITKYADNWPWCFLERVWDQVLTHPNDQ